MKKKDVFTGRGFGQVLGRGFGKMMVLAPPVGLEPTTDWLTASASDRVLSGSAALPN